MEIIINSPKYGEHKVLIDDGDYELFKKYTWYIKKEPYATYVYTTIYHQGGKRTSLRLHRFLMSAVPGIDVDHKNHNGLDNRRSNLRCCDRTRNNANTRKRKNTSSKYKGVVLCINKKWSAQIYINKKKIHLGYFTSEIEAAKAYNEAAKKYFGEFALLNVIEEEVV